MRRDPRALEDVLWDVLVIGGGIHGAWVAWDAILRGLLVCLVDKADFGSATSANTLKIIHGGLRYLQHGDYRRMRESIGERRVLLEIAPHLVHPLPIVVPTYGHGWRGPEILRVALLLNDLIAAGSNAGLDAAQRIPRGRIVSRRECLRLAPGLEAAGVTGAGVFYDAQVSNSERLVLALLESAAKAGAALANYAEVTGLRRDPDGALRVSVNDRLTEETFSVRARIAVNATGPWVEHVLERARSGARPVASFAKAFNVVTRRLFPHHAVALPVHSDAGRRDRKGRRGPRLLFVAPWREQSLIGTWYERHDEGADDVRVAEAEVARLLAEVNRACPALEVTLDDVRLVHRGLLPLAGTHGDAPDTQLARHGSIVDHTADGASGLLSVVGVKYTTARLMAERTVDAVFAQLRRTPPRSLSAAIRLHAGDGGVETAADGASSTGAAAIIREQVQHAIRAEMAHTLSDVVFRRTDLGTAGDPGPERLRVAAETAAAELGWSPDRQRAELSQVYGRFGVPR